MSIGSEHLVDVDVVEEHCQSWLISSWAKDALGLSIPHEQAGWRRADLQPQFAEFRTGHDALFLHVVGLGERHLVRRLRIETPQAGIEPGLCALALGSSEKNGES